MSHLTELHSNERETLIKTIIQSGIHHNRIFIIKNTIQPWFQK